MFSIFYDIPSYVNCANTGINLLQMLLFAVMYTTKMIKHGLNTERVEIPVTPGGSNVGDSTPTTPYVAAMNDTEKVVRTMARTNAESDGAATTGNVAASQTLAKLDDLRKVCCVAFTTIAL